MKSLLLLAACAFAPGALFAQAKVGGGSWAPFPAAAPAYSVQGTVFEAEASQMFEDWNKLDLAHYSEGLDQFVAAWRRELNPERQQAFADMIRVLTADSREAKDRLAAAGLDRKLIESTQARGLALRRYAQQSDSLAHAVEEAHRAIAPQTEPAEVSQDPAAKAGLQAAADVRERLTELERGQAVGPVGDRS